jgi:nucleotide-binding universal stress UspA family protein
MAAIKRILCPVDFSPASEHALAHAMGLAEQFRARVDVLHAFPVAVYQLTDGAITAPPHVVAEQSARLEEALDQLVKTHARKGVVLDHRLVVGAPQEAILDALERTDYDLVVMGTHGRTGWRRAWLGSVAERVVRMSHVPVLTVPMADSAEGAPSP